DKKRVDNPHYRPRGARSEPILWTIGALHERGIWLEIVTLLIPGFNNGEEEPPRLTSSVAAVSPLIPGHTTPDMLLRAAGMGRANGLKYVYAGNLPGRVGDLENTRCHVCQSLLVER